MKITASQAKELKNILKSIPDSRKANGLRHSQASVLALLYVLYSAVAVALLRLVSGPVDAPKTC